MTMLADIKRNMRYLLQFKKYGLDLFKHMYSYNHIDIKSNKFRLIPIQPTLITYDVHNMIEYTYKFNGLSYSKYQYYLISIVNFHERSYTTITNKIYRKPITLSHSIYNIKESYMLVMPKTPPKESRRDATIVFLTESSNIRLCELNGSLRDTVMSTLFSITCVDKSGYNITIRKHHLSERLRAYKRKKLQKICNHVINS